FGIVTVQIYHYYRKYPGDTLWLKALVASVWSVLLGHSIAVAVGVYTISVLNFRQPLFNSRFPLGLASSILFSAFLAPITLVQSPMQLLSFDDTATALSFRGFFAYRIHVVSKRRFVPAFIWLLCFVRFIGSFSLGAYAIKRGDSLQTIVADFAWPIQRGIASEAGLDTAIALTMCYYLRREKSIAITRTTLLLNRLMKYTIETGALRSLATLTVVICYATVPANMVWFAVFLIAAEVYANALLANLNARKPHRNNDEKDYGLPRLTVLPDFEARNSRLQRSPARRSKDDPDPVTPDYATDGISLTPSVSTAFA
ncbi:hypothetical protein BJ138DRAFT_1228782, partial [Hygrophoropsis aurantiaca]